MKKADGKPEVSPPPQRAYIGIRPSYGEEVEGVKLDGVSGGSPAEKAGLKGGDIIVGFGGEPVQNIEDFMASLVRYKPGDEVDVVVDRYGQKMTLKVQLGAGR